MSCDRTHLEGFLLRERECKKGDVERGDWSLDTGAAEEKREEKEGGGGKRKRRRRRKEEWRERGRDRKTGREAERER